jgi:phosphatidate phosphatase APP1
LLLRDVDLDRASWSAATQARSKVESMELLIARYPGLRWVLVGDSGQVDAELYAGIVDRFPGRILAVYVRDSNAIAAHARGLGLLAPAQLPEVAAEVRADQARPETKDSIKDGTVQAVADTLRPDGR